MCFTTLYKRLVIALNLEGKSCDLNNQRMVGPGAMASHMCFFVQNTSPDNKSVVILHYLCLLLSILLYISMFCENRQYKCTVMVISETERPLWVSPWW